MSPQQPLSPSEITEIIKKYDKVLKLEGEKEADKVFDKVPIPTPKNDHKISNGQLLKKVESGDIILWSGSSGISKKIRLASNSPFSHASIVFKGALDEEEAKTDVVNTPRIFQATWSKFEQDIHGDHSKVSRQVMLNDLSIVLKENELENEPASLRVLVCSADQRKELTKKLKEFINESSGDMYPGADKGVPDLSSYQQGLQGIRIDHPTQFICSELVAEALLRMNVIDDTKAVNSFCPNDFSDESYKKLKPQLKDGFEFGHETFVEP